MKKDLRARGEQATGSRNNVWSISYCSCACYIDLYVLMSFCPLRPFVYFCSEALS